jgi:hypothetical protein
MSIETYVEYPTREAAEEAGEWRGQRGYSEVYWGPVERQVRAEDGVEVWVRRRVEFKG